MTQDTTRLLLDAQAGDDGAVEQLYDYLYEELRVLAHRQLVRAGQPQTLNTTALVHEAYVKLFDRTRLSVRDRSHFFALSARAMRQILVDRFRRANAGKRGGALPDLSLDEGRIPVEDRGAVILEVDAALTRLAALNERLAKVVECRFFGGMTQEQIGSVLGVTERTVRSDWKKARAFLARELSRAT